MVDRILAGQAGSLSPRLFRADFSPSCSDRQPQGPDALIVSQVGVFN
jgi:hypothetical protein